jgi:hypothetical protein
VPPAGSNKAATKTFLKIASDGVTTGSVEVFLNGQGAADSRAWARDLTKNTEDDLVKNMFRRQGVIGSGKLEKDDPKELLDSYHYKISLTGEKYLKVPGPGAFYIYPPFGLGAPIQSGLQGASEVEKEAHVTCGGIHLVEDYVIELPKDIKVLSIPDDMEASIDLVSYKATYKIEDNVLTVRRVLDDRTTGNTCSPQTMQEYKKIAEKVSDNLKSQVLYK